MLDAYYEAFEQFLQTGNPEALTPFTDADTDAAFWNVYRNGYLKTCTDALAASYPVVGSLLGEDYFRRLARSYVEAYPPRRGTLVGYGRRFPEFLQSRAAEHGLRYLADFAVIDAAWLSSYFAAAGEALAAADVESMAARGLDVSTTRVMLTPPTQLVNLRYPIVDTWARLHEQGALTGDIELHPGDTTAMLWRTGGQVHIRALARGEAAFLTTLAPGATLEAAAIGAMEADGAFDLAVTFAALLENQILQLGSDTP